MKYEFLQFDINARWATSPKPNQLVTRCAAKRYWLSRSIRYCRDAGIWRFSLPGFPTVAMVGVDGVKAAFILVQHADSDPGFQANILKVLRHRLPTGEINANQFAMLTDRVLLAQGKRQRYGTQFENQRGEWVPSPMEEKAHVDQRRKALGLVSLAHYACMLRAQ